jgi:hypothetical protein
MRSTFPFNVLHAYEGLETRTSIVSAILANPSYFDVAHPRLIIET